MKTTTFFKVFATAVALFLFGSAESFAQLKVGTNPTTIGTNSALEVEGTNNSKTVILKSNGNLGVGTDTPNARLHVNGDQILGTVESLSSSAGTSQVVRDNSTGTLKVLKAATGSVAPITLLTYTINNVDGDWIANFDTKIPVADYTLAVVGVVFIPPTNNWLVNNASGAGGNGYNPLNFTSFQTDGTWRLSVDYAGGSTSTGTANGGYKVQCLVINNSLAQSLSQTAALGGNNTGAASSKPAGL